MPELRSHRAASTLCWTRIPIHPDHPSGHPDHPSDLHVETVAFSLELVVAFPRNHWSPSDWNRWSPSSGIRILGASSHGMHTDTDNVPEASPKSL